MVELTKEIILHIHDRMIKEYGGEYGIRDNDLFELECVAPYQSFGGVSLYPDIYDKAVKYLFGFATNQVFIDGNKRTAVETMIMFLDVNEIELDVTSKDLAKLTLDVANYKISEEEVKDFLKLHTI